MYFLKALLIAITITLGLFLLFFIVIPMLSFIAIVAAITIVCYFIITEEKEDRWND